MAERTQAKMTKLPIKTAKANDSLSHRASSLRPASNQKHPKLQSDEPNTSKNTAG